MMEGNLYHRLHVLPLILIALVLVASACDPAPRSSSVTHGGGSPSLDLIQPASGYGFRMFCTRSLGATIRVFGSDPDQLASDKEGVLMAMDPEYDYEITVEWKSVSPTPGVGPDASNPAVALRHRLGVMAAQGMRFSSNAETIYKDLHGDPMAQTMLLLEKGAKPQNASVAAWYCKGSRRMFIMWITSDNRSLDSLKGILDQ